MFKLRCWEGGVGRWRGGERRVGELSPMSHISAHKSPCPPHCQLCYSTLFRYFLHLNVKLSRPLPYNVISANPVNLSKMSELEITSRWNWNVNSKSLEIHYKISRNTLQNVTDTSEDAPEVESPLCQWTQFILTHLSSCLFVLAWSLPLLDTFYQTHLSGYLFFLACLDFVF